MTDRYFGRQRDLATWLERQKGPVAAVFDVGTKAARILVGPRELPIDDWPRGLFFNDSLLTDLGAEQNRFNRKLPPDSRILHRLIRFLRAYYAQLRDCGVEARDIDAVGTAVFRELRNRDEILTLIERETGLRLQVVADDDEALFSLAGVVATHEFRRGGDIELGEDDAILLLDQGGGSMEVSYIFPEDRNRWDVHSFDDLGTIALRETFFSMGPEGTVDPSLNNRRISTQNQRMRDFIDARVRSWDGYPDLAGRRIHAYGLGSAITKCFPGRNNHAAHNARVDVASMRATVDGACSALEESQRQVRSLYKELMVEKDAADRRRGGRRHRRSEQSVADRLLVLYGLPVYETILRRFGLDDLRVCGYGLRYGVFVWRHQWDVPLVGE